MEFLIRTTLWGIRLRIAIMDWLLAEHFITLEQLVEMAEEKPKFSKWLREAKDYAEREGHILENLQWYSEDYAEEQYNAGISYEEFVDDLLDYE